MSPIHARSARGLALFVAISLSALAAPPKRALTHKDYDPWRSIASPTLSRSGDWLAYSLMPQEGDGDLVIRNLKTGKETRHAVGALPPAPVIDPAEATGDTPPPPRGIRILFTSDNQWVVATTYPAKAETEKARKERRRADDMPKNGLLLINLATAQETRIDRVKSVQVPSKGGPWVAYLKEAKPAPVPAAKPAEPAKSGDEDDADQARRAGAAGGSGSTSQYGTDLVLRDLTKTENAETTFESVLDYSFARDGATLLYTVGSRTVEQNGVYAVKPGSTAAALLSGKGKYTKITWDREQQQAAFFCRKEEQW